MYRLNLRTLDECVRDTFDYKCRKDGWHHHREHRKAQSFGTKMASEYDKNCQDGSLPAPCFGRRPGRTPNNLAAERCHQSLTTCGPFARTTRQTMRRPRSGASRSSAKAGFGTAIDPVDCCRRTHLPTYHLLPEWLASCHEEVAALPFHRAVTTATSREIGGPRFGTVWSRRRNGWPPITENSFGNRLHPMPWPHLPGNACSCACIARINHEFGGIHQHPVVYIVVICRNQSNVVISDHLGIQRDRLSAHQFWVLA